MAVTLLYGQGQKVGVKVKGQGQRSGKDQISGAQWSIIGARLCRLQQRAIRVITSLRCLCVCNQWAYADNRANAVDRRFNV